jgi:hypothetical protein
MPLIAWFCFRPPPAQLADATPAEVTDFEHQGPAADKTQFVSATEPPYARFVFFSICSTLAASTTSFIWVDGVARQQWNSVPLAVLATVACLLFLNAAVKTAGRLGQIGTSEVLLRKKKLVRRIIFFAVLFIGTAAFIGNGIGTSGAETSHLLSDIGQMSQIGDRISKARSNAALTIPAQVEMYKSIEPDVEQLSVVLGRLKQEYATYDSKFPAQHETTEKALQSSQTGVKRMDLLRQQIAVAKLIEELDANAQVEMWREQMQPLLDREDELDPPKQR